MILPRNDFAICLELKVLYLFGVNIFKNIDSSACDEVFEFGKDGKPFYCQGPYDTPARMKTIMATLDANCGVSGEDYFTMLSYAVEG